MSAKTDAALEQFERENNSASDYLTENWRKDENGQVPNFVLYKMYRDWCEESGRKYYAEIGFGRVAARMFGRSIVVKEKGKCLRYYRCVNSDTPESSADAPTVAAQFGGIVIE